MDIKILKNVHCQVHLGLSELPKLLFENQWHYYFKNKLCLNIIYSMRTAFEKMFDLIKQWTQKLKLNVTREKTKLAALPLEDYTYTEEECYNVNEIYEETKQMLPINKKVLSESCGCSNCAALLPFLAECGICLEPLQSHGVGTCQICSNLICISCASRLTTCAYCRTELPMQKNRALEKLLEKLILPCKNSRYGCTVLLGAQERSKHEAICNFTLISCPQGLNRCCWRGTANEIQNHMKSSHQFNPLKDSGVRIEIYNFLKKVEASEGRQYKVCLSCYNQFFFAKVTTLKGKLRISVTRVGYTERIPLDSPLPEYSVFIGIFGKTKNLGGVTLFESDFWDTRETEIDCWILYENATSIDEQDLVQIYINIQQINSFS